MSLAHGAIAELAIAETSTAEERVALITSTQQVPGPVDVVMVRRAAPMEVRLTREGQAADRMPQQGGVPDAPWKQPLRTTEELLADLRNRRVWNVTSWLDER